MIADADATGDDGRAALERLMEDPATVSSLAEFLRRLPELNAALDVLRDFVHSSSRLADNAADIVQTARTAAAAEGASMDRLESLMRAAGTGTRLLEEMAEPLDQPETVTSLRELIEMVPKLVAVLDILEQFVAGSSRFAENLNDIVLTARKAAEKTWPELESRKSLLDLPGELLQVVESPALRRLLGSRVLSDEALDVMDQVADATIEAHRESITTDARLGRFAAFKALGDPDVQRGLALTLGLARSLGRRMHAEHDVRPGADASPSPGTRPDA